MYQPARTLRQTRSPEPLSERLKISDSLSKLSNESFFFSTHLTPGNGLCISWDPWDPHQSPKTTISTIRTNPFSWAALREGPAGTLGTMFTPKKKPVILGPFLKEERPVILSQNCQMHLFFSQPPSPMTRGHVLAIWDPADPHWSP